MKEKNFRAYTDGSSTVYYDNKNLRYGGVGVYIESSEYWSEEEISKHYVGDEGDDSVSNQKMELLACIKALKRFNNLIKKFNLNKKNQIEIITDSMYVINCITKWSEKWKKNGWKRDSKGTKDIKNLYLIKELYNLSKAMNIKYIHINSHKKEPNKNDIENWRRWYGNKMSDKLALDGRNQVMNQEMNQEIK